MWSRKEFLEEFITDVDRKTLSKMISIAMSVEMTDITKVKDKYIVVKPSEEFPGKIEYLEYWHVGNRQYFELHLDSPNVKELIDVSDAMIYIEE